MVEDIALSIIIPAFNASCTIQRCLESIYRLPLHENVYEVIVVDDASVDQTVDVVESYKRTHANLIILKQSENHRQGAARNRGLEISRGRYIMFVDSDDAVSVDGVMNALSAVTISKSDICYYDTAFQTRDGEWKLVDIPSEIRNSLMNNREYLESYYTTYYNGPCRNLYKTSFLKSTGVLFVEDVQWEDCDWTVKVYSCAKSIQFVDGVGYLYYNNGNSTSNQRGVKAMSDRVFAGLRLMLYGKEVKDTFPKLSGIITSEGRYSYVVDVLRLRNLTKYKVSAIAKLYDLLEKKCLFALRQFRWSGWIHFFIHFKYPSLALLCLLSPCAGIGRKLVGKMRKS